MSKSQIPLNDKIADFVLNIISAGGIAGGGIGAYKSLFENPDSDIPKAILSAVIGLSISYGAKLLRPVDKKIRDGLEKTGQAFDNEIDRVTDRMINAAKGFDKKYLLCQAAACNRSRTEGVPDYDGILTPLLKDVYVPLALDISAISSNYDQDLDIWMLLERAKRDPNFKQIAILAWGGFGKTTLLKHIAFKYGTKQQPRKAPNLIPVLIILRNHREFFLQQELPDLPQFITENHISSLPLSSQLKSAPPNWARNILEEGRAIIMLDGFDEIAEENRSQVSAWINRQIWNYGKSIFILTSRPIAYKNLDVATRLKIPTIFWIKEFNQQQIKGFVKKWYLCHERHFNMKPDTPDIEDTAYKSANSLLRQIEARQELRELAKNPLLLNMIATFHRRYSQNSQGVQLPRRRVDLYQAIIKLQLYDKLHARAINTILTTDKEQKHLVVQKILQYVAIDMMKNRETQIEPEQLREKLDKIIQKQGKTIEPTEFLDQVVQLSELIVQKDDKYEFAHSSFQEFLAAIHICEEQKENVLYSHFQDDFWKPTILLYAAKTEHPDSLISALVNCEMTDLAYECLKETSKNVDAKLKKRVLDARYSTLESYLQEKQWKNADKETYRLMVTSVGKEYGQLFETEELMNFPSEELLIIDNLWVKWSKGLFGFSVQKDIYLSQEIGGIVDGCFHKKAWIKFCHKISWMKNGECAPINFSLSSPRGHLPVVVCKDCTEAKLGANVLACCYSLFSHPDLQCTQIQDNNALKV